jgi:hypothetical protein
MKQVLDEKQSGIRAGDVLGVVALQDKPGLRAVYIPNSQFTMDFRDVPTPVRLERRVGPQNTPAREVWEAVNPSIVL